MKKIYTRHKDMHGHRIYEGDYVRYPKALGFVYRVLWGQDNSCWGMHGVYTWVTLGTNGLATYLYDSSNNLEKCDRRGRVA